eukprot:Colp12_sorted_trinity150504_noHs@3204
MADAQKTNKRPAGALTAKALKKAKVEYNGETRPARRQVEHVPRREIAVNEGSYNIWYERWSGTDYRDRTRDRDPATTKCVPSRDSGYTKADINDPDGTQSYFCLHFAKGSCHLGFDCNYYHRIPRPIDNLRIDLSRDCFGRERKATTFGENGKNNAIEHTNSTLYIGGVGMHPGISKEELIRREFGAFGPIERINIIDSKGIAFVKYYHRVNAEFGKVAMSDQLLEGKEQLNVRWANDDPNPNRKQENIDKAKQMLEQAAEERGIVPNVDIYGLPQSVNSGVVGYYSSTEHQYADGQPQDPTQQAYGYQGADQSAYGQYGYGSYTPEQYAAYYQNYQYNAQASQYAQYAYSAYAKQQGTEATTQEESKPPGEGETKAGGEETAGGNTTEISFDPNDYETGEPEEAEQEEAEGGQEDEDADAQERTEENEDVDDGEKKAEGTKKEEQQQEQQTPEQQQYAQYYAQYQYDPNYYNYYQQYYYGNQQNPYQAQQQPSEQQQPQQAQQTALDAYQAVMSGAKPADVAEIAKKPAVRRPPPPPPARKVENKPADPKKLTALLADYDDGEAETSEEKDNTVQAESEEANNSEEKATVEEN